MNRNLRDNEKYIFTSSYKYFFNFSRNKIFPFLLISSVKIISLKIIKNIKKLSAVVKIKICHNRKIIDFFQSGKRRWPSKFSTLLTHWFCGGSNPTLNVLEVCDCEIMEIKIQALSRVIHSTKIIHHLHDILFPAVLWNILWNN